MKYDGERESGISRRIKSPEDFLDCAQAYYASDFPNPNREGCLDQEKTRHLVRSGILPDDQMRLHLFSCSDCFVEYREAIAVYSKTSEQPRASSWGLALFVSNWRPVNAFAAAAFLIFVAGFALILYKYGGLPLQSIQPAAPSETAGPAYQVDLPADKEGSPADKRVTRRLKQKTPFRSGDRKLLASVTKGEIKIDLRGDLLRGVKGGQEGGRSIKLPPRSTFSFELPDNSSTGQYQVTVFDPFGNQLTSSKAVSRDGKTLKTLLDLRRLPGSRYRICVAHLNEAPNCFLITIRNNTSTGK